MKSALFLMFIAVISIHFIAVGSGVELASKRVACLYHNIVEQISESVEEVCADSNHAQNLQENPAQNPLLLATITGALVDALCIQVRDLTQEEPAEYARQVAAGRDVTEIDPMWHTPFDEAEMSYITKFADFLIGKEKDTLSTRGLLARLQAELPDRYTDITVISALKKTNIRK